MSTWHRTSTIFLLATIFSLSSDFSFAQSRAKSGVAEAANNQKSYERKNEKPASFLRLVHEKDGSSRLETSIASYKGKGGKVVHLVSVVHVGEKPYFQQLNRIFRDYDALLYELIAEKDAIPQPGRDSSSILTIFQRGLTDGLSLQFQLDIIDYTADNFVHADMSPNDFRRKQNEHGEGLLTYMFRAMKTELDRQAKGDFSGTVTPIDLIKVFLSEDRSTEMKRVLSREFANVESIAETIEGENGSVILAERNKVAIKVLENSLKEGKRNIGIFYGAAHMPDMEKRLIEKLEFRKTGERWLTAWDIPAPATKRSSFLKRLLVPGDGKQERPRRTQWF